MLPVVDAAKDGSETRPNGLYPSGTGITRSSNERPSSASPRPINPSFSAQARNNCGRSRTTAGFLG